jgi:acyl-CoA thioesterase I
VGGLSGWGSLAYGAAGAFLKLCAALTLTTGLAAAEPVTIVALGDSLTQGYGLAPPDGFVPQMSRWLDEHGAEVDLRNAGVSGDTTAGGLARVEWSLDETVDAMIVALGGNDLLRGLDPALSRENLQGILEIAEARELPVLLVGMTAPSNYGPEFKAEFDAMYPDLADAYDTLYFPEFLKGIADLPDRAQAVERYLQPDRIHPNAEGVARVVEAMGPAVLELVGAAD